ncbi:MogA/MoaB family molybdenum cofactor biosynthesis protein [Leucobacter sp. CSA2]|uniref:MogA/MoaB family molybdenum cofactor biosynthesis protein n=1 Tax=Leucobacter edaphi TaxID=2796472 RepID=A0A934UVQ2_9MICO|nr:MogA/MoaB family molybdenum cofactor biosynthesis protein [Leucobacter edaphi]
MSARRTAVVLVISTSAAAGEAQDRTGPVIADWLAERGFAVGDPVIAADGEPAAAALAGTLHRDPDVILTTGGTGVSPTDCTPEIVDPLLDVRVPGLIEALRRRGAEQLPAALLTRGVAGFAGRTFIMTLPGSPGGVRDGLAVLDPLIGHLIQQRAGSADGHPPR